MARRSVLCDAHDRDERQPEIAHLDQDAKQRRLVTHRTGKNGLPIRLMRDGHPLEPFRPVRIQVSQDTNLIECLRCHIWKIVGAQHSARSRTAPVLAVLDCASGHYASDIDVRACLILAANPISFPLRLFSDQRPNTRPPFTFSNSPVMNPASGEARKSAAATTSFG
jgi:hypothetical protein